MSKDRATVGTDGQPLPVLPPERDARVWARACRIMFYTPGFLALLLLKVGEPTGFGISVELLMLASMSAVVAVIFMGSSSDGAGANHSSRTGVWSGCLVLELLAVVPLLTAVPSLFHELANSKLLHDPAVTSDRRGAGLLGADPGRRDPALHAVPAGRLRHAAFRAVQDRQPGASTSASWC